MDNHPKKPIIPDSSSPRHLTLRERLEKIQADAEEVMGKEARQYEMFSEEAPIKRKKPAKRRNGAEKIGKAVNPPQKTEKPVSGAETGKKQPPEDDMPVLNDVQERIEREARLAKDNAQLQEEMLRDNEIRLNRLRLVGINQITGEGIPDHTEKVVIQDHDIPTQYLTREVAENKLYKKVVSLGSVEAYAEYINVTRAAELGRTAVTAEDVKKMLLLTRLKRDPAFAFATCFKIQDKASGKNIPFLLNYPQIILLRMLERMRRQQKPIRVILLKARQWGGSTLTQLYMAWIQLFVKQGWNSVIIAQTKDTARRIKSMYTRTLAHFPAQVVFDIPKLRFAPKENSSADSTITDEGGKVIRDNVVTIASFENFESTRGANFAMAHFSEVAYWLNTPGKTAEALITNIAGGMLMAPLTLEVMESTANGMSGYFYDEYQIAKDPKKKSSREALFIPFFYILNDTKPFKDENERIRFAEKLVRERFDDTETVTTESGAYLFSLWKKGATLEGINWYIEQRARFHDHASIASEAPSDDVECFKHSGHTIFDQYLIDRYRKQFVRDPVYTGDIMQPDGKTVQLAPSDPKGLLWIWQQPDNSPTADRYMVVVDVGGRSTKADFSVITVVDRWPLRFGGKIEVVARWRGHIRYDFLAMKAVFVAKYYNKALLVFESNTFDKKKAESTEFVEVGDHTRGILSTIEDTYENLYMRTSTSPEDIRQGKYKKVGFQTNVKTKQDMVDHFIVSFEDNTRFLDPDYRVYEEMAIYEQREDGSYGNIVGRDNHDDILMTDMIADLISDQLPMPSIPKPTAYEEWTTGTLNESFL
jgi:hypothetical protein